MTIAAINKATISPVTAEWARTFVTDIASEAKRSPYALSVRMEQWTPDQAYALHKLLYPGIQEIRKSNRITEWSKKINIGEMGTINLQFVSLDGVVRLVGREYLCAICASDASARVLVVTKATQDKARFDKLISRTGQHQPRSQTDALTRIGEELGGLELLELSSYSAALPLALLVFDTTGSGSSHKKVALLTSKSLRRAAAEYFAPLYKLLSDSLSGLPNSQRKVLFRSGHALACALLMMKSNQKECIEFWKSTLTAESASDSAGTLALNQWLFHASKGVKRLSPKVIAYCLDAHRKGVTVNIPGNIKAAIGKVETLNQKHFMKIFQEWRRQSDDVLRVLMPTDTEES